MQARTHPTGRTLYVDERTVEKGSKAPFYVVYGTRQGEQRWGFFCSNCETFDNAVDAMGRIQCNECRNVHKAEEWDAAHE